jgi:hypothetical protein
MALSKNRQKIEVYKNKRQQMALNMNRQNIEVYPRQGTEYGIEHGQTEE